MLNAVTHSKFQIPNSKLPEDSLEALDPISSRPDARLRFDQRILLLALAAGLPATLVALILLWTGSYTPKVQWTLTVLIVGVWTSCSFSVRHRVVLPLQTLSNLLAALRESDFSIRARGASGDDPLGAVMLEVNVLASMLHDQRLGALEAGALLRTVMVEIDVAVFTFDGTQTLRLVNRAGERLLQQPVDRLLGRAAAELGLRAGLGGPPPRLDAVPVAALVRRVAGVETRLGIRVEPSPDVTIRADPDQLEQLLINLLHNAVDAALETGGGVTVAWTCEGRTFELWIEDEGAGLPNASNLFVPFFPTEAGG